MTGTKQSIAVSSVLELHEWIAEVFQRKASSDALEKLYGAFHRDFRMITISGQVWSVDQVRQLFTSRQGARPGLHIGIEDITVIADYGDDIWVRYQENHDEEGMRVVRQSTACIHVTGQGWCWRYLQETPSTLARNAGSSR
ncbi:hypothetical protein [Alloalcanivorax xenomutans]|uniref:hypothetical protein n=1 Tax=Alloalcanivorax xenomutans TaxID=1094342 RepID=UPI0003B8AA93|nr:hypothetical protein Q668_19040 [Alcanivorax sp. PN-3]